MLSYTCNFACDHCFLYCSPDSCGTMTIAQIKTLLKEAEKIGTVNEIYFEGGEPFLFYPLMIEGVRLARSMGYNTGIVSNGYWATTAEDAELWLKPLSELGIYDLSVSNDTLHYGDEKDNPADFALAAAGSMGIPANSLCKERPEALNSPDAGSGRGTPEISGGIKLRGRAVEKFADKLPAGNIEEFRECPYEDLADPKRVHIDSYGNVQICQGISMGNCSKTPLSELVREYDAERHPVSGPLVRGGPVRLIEEYNIIPDREFADECHLCYWARMALIDKFPEFLAPGQVYGLD